MVNSVLATNLFLVPFVKNKRSTVSFVAGQPLGYYSYPLPTGGVLDMKAKVYTSHLIKVRGQSQR